MTKKLNALFGFIIALSLCTGCSATTPKYSPNLVKPDSKVKVMWWGKAGDMAEYEKAKGIAQNYDWVVMAQDLYTN